VTRPLFESEGFGEKVLGAVAWAQKLNISNRTLVANRPLLCASGLGGSFPLAIFTAKRSEKFHVAAHVVRLDELRYSQAALTTYVLVSASGSHASLLEARRRIENEGGALQVVTLSPNSALASGAQSIAPPQDLFSPDEFLALRNSLALARILDAAFGDDGPVALVSHELSDDDVAQAAQNGAVVVYDDVGRALSEDLAMRCRETRLSNMLFQHVSDFVHGGFAALTPEHTAICIGGPHVAELQKKLLLYGCRASLRQTVACESIFAALCWSMDLHRRIVERTSRFAVHSTPLNEALWRQFR